MRSQLQEEPLPLGFVSKLLLPGKSTSAAQRKVNAAISCVSALLPVQDECIHFFHKSVKDWLIDKSNYGQHYFSVDEKEGHEVLSKVCIDELDDVKRKGVTFAKFSDTTRYALQHGVQHMLQLEDARVCSLEEVVKKFVLDVELLYAKLCVNVTAAFEDIVCVQKLAGIEELQRALNALLVLLRKHIATLEKVPHAIFQTLLNEGEPELSSQALNLLETKYSEMRRIWNTCTRTICKEVFKLNFNVQQPLRVLMFHRSWTTWYANVLMTRSSYGRSILARSYGDEMPR